MIRLKDIGNPTFANVRSSRACQRPRGRAHNHRGGGSELDPSGRGEDSYRFGDAAAASKTRK